VVKFIEKPTLVKTTGSGDKIIAEYFGNVNSDNKDISVAHMKASPGWSEVGQRPDFDEYTVMISGSLQVEIEEETITLEQGQGILISSGEWVRYSVPFGEMAEYIAVCLPAFTLQLANLGKK
tara:strand:- start:1611 stop:1976 length:366 start_codon:yes stop_codon:yes gene_type:complete